MNGLRVSVPEQGLELPIRFDRFDGPFELLAQRLGEKFFDGDVELLGEDGGETGVNVVLGFQKIRHLFG